MSSVKWQPFCPGLNWLNDHRWGFKISCPCTTLLCFYLPDIAYISGCEHDLMIMYQLSGSNNHHQGDIPISPKNSFGTSSSRCFDMLSPKHAIMSFSLSAVQNERDRISVRRTSYEDMGQNGSLSVSTLLNAEILSRQVCTKLLDFLSCRWVSARKT